MKHLRCLFAAATMMMVGCTAGVEEPNPDNSIPTPSGTYAIKVNGSITQEYITRVDDGGFCDGDQVGLWGVNYTDGNSTPGTLVNEGNQVDNALYTYNESENRWVSSGSVYYKDAETNIDLYAYYPYGYPKSVSAYEFEVQQDQSGETLIDGYSQSDFLWAYAENVTPSESAVRLRFSHRLSCANVVLVEGEGFASGEWDALDKTVMVVNTTRKAAIDLSSGEATAVGSATGEGIVMKEGADGYRAVVVPQSVGSGLSLFSITIDGVAYRFKGSSTFVYESGKQSKFTITINKKSPSGEYEFALTDCSIVDWIADAESHDGEARQYYCVHLDEAGSLESKIAADGKNPAKIKNLKVSGKINWCDFRFMRDKMTILQAVNLKESEIVALTWANLYKNGYVSSDAYKDDTRSPEGSHHTETGYLECTGAHEIPTYAFMDKSTLTHFVFPEKVTKIGGQAFSNTLLSGALIIPDDVTEIGFYAFSNTNISSLQLPHGLKVLGEHVFEGCSSLSGSLVLPESLESIGGWCFHGCNMLSGTLTLPSKLKEIPNACFQDCSFSGDLIIPEGVTTVGRVAFSGAGPFKSLTLPQGLKELGESAFFLSKIQGELVVPKEVMEIQDNCFYGCSFTSIKFAEDSELIKIGNKAFRDNFRLSEPVELPAGVMTIGSQAFYSCSLMPSITIPAGVASIGNSAFSVCSYLTSLRCDATMPPVVGSSAFDGVPKDNFTLEVPETSVARYQTATGWSDFKRISAHHDFSISRKHMRVLNAECSKTYLLRTPTDAEWSVESCPEWVTVTPSSGVGRTEVTITVSQMDDSEVGTFTNKWMDTFGKWTTEDHAGRAGEIVFLYGAKDYRSRMTVEQYDSDNYDGQVVVNQEATKGTEGVNIVFMGDCFDARDIATGAYISAIDEAIGYYFAIEPYKHYKPYFNIYTVVGMSPDSGMGTVNTIKDAKFGSQYSLDGIAPDVATTYEYAMKAATVNEENLAQTLVVMVENTTDYGGITYMWADGSAIAICPISRDAYPFDFRGIVQHEAGGHGFAKLGDEYIYHNAFIESCECPCCAHLDAFNTGKALGWYRNLSTNGDYKTVEWAHLFEHPDYSAIVDMYEGGYFHTRGIYRSEGNSCMNNNVPYYSAIQRQEMVERIMLYAGEEFDIQEFYNNDVRDASNNDFVTRSSFSFEENAAYRTAAAKQQAPKFMGNKPQLNK